MPETPDGGWKMDDEDLEFGPYGDVERRDGDRGSVRLTGDWKTKRRPERKGWERD